jgi:hypothetical protein
MDGGPVPLSITMSAMPGAFVDLRILIPNHPRSPISDVPILSSSVDERMHTPDSSAAFNSDDRMCFTPMPLLAHSHPASFSNDHMHIPMPTHSHSSSIDVQDTLFNEDMPTSHKRHSRTPSDTVQTIPQFDLFNDEENTNLLDNLTHLPVISEGTTTWLVKYSYHE